jgi:hypothetical protein
MYEKARHECGVRYLCYLRHKKGLTWFRNYIAEKHINQVLLNDYFDQWKLGNKGEWGCWKKSLLQAQEQATLL